MIDNKISIFFKNNSNSFFYLFFILLIQCVFLNRLEKKFFGQRINNYLKYRPLNYCKNNYLSSFCLGMPSGHSEFIVILSVFLCVKKIIPWQLAILLIIVVGWQRIFSKMHTYIQVLAGIIFGLFYSWVFILTGYSYKSLFFIITVTLIFFILTCYY